MQSGEPCSTHWVTGRLDSFANKCFVLPFFQVFKRFNYLLDEADKWAEDGVKRRRMIAACLEYN